MPRKVVVESPKVYSLRNLKQMDEGHGVPISMGIKARGTFLFSKQVPVDSKGNSVGKDDMVVQTRQVLENLKAQVLEAGATMADVVSVTWYTTRIDDYYRSTSSRLRKEYFPEPYPTSVVVEVSRLALPEWAVELQAITVVPD